MSAPYFECAECGDIIHTHDRHKQHSECCEGCGDTRHVGAETEALEAATAELQELVDALVDSGNLAAIRAAEVALQEIKLAEADG